MSTKEANCVDSVLGALLGGEGLERRVPRGGENVVENLVSCSAFRKQGPKGLASLSPLKGTPLPIQIPVKGSAIFQ